MARHRPFRPTSAGLLDHVAGHGEESPQSNPRGAVARGAGVVLAEGQSSVGNRERRGDR